MNDYELYHYGVKGMKWGVKKSAKSLSKKSTSSKKSKKPGRAKRSMKSLMKTTAKVACRYVAVNRGEKAANDLFSGNFGDSLDNALLAKRYYDIYNQIDEL